MKSMMIITVRASCGAVYFNRSCVWVCVCLWVLCVGVCVFVGPMCGCVCVFVGLLPRLLESACVIPHQTGFVGKGSDHLQLIKFWPSRAQGRGSAAGRIFGSSLLQPVCSVCISECFIIIIVN